MLQNEHATIGADTAESRPNLQRCANPTDAAHVAAMGQVRFVAGSRQSFGTGGSLQDSVSTVPKSTLTFMARAGRCSLAGRAPNRSPRASTTRVGEHRRKKERSRTVTN